MHLLKKKVDILDMPIFKEKQGNHVEEEDFPESKKERRR